MSPISLFLAFTLLLAYFALHSVLAADSVKTWFAARLGANVRYYRLAYNVMATLLLLILLYWLAGWADGFLFKKNAWTNAVAFVLLAVGAWLSIGSLWQYDLGEFTGIQQLQQKNSPPNQCSLNTIGFNAIVRHPLYLGLILVLLGVFLFYPKMSALLLLASVLVYLPFGIYLEEKKLRRVFGQAYLDYEKLVKCLIPGIW